MSDIIILNQDVDFRVLRKALKALRDGKSLPDVMQLLPKEKEEEDEETEEVEPIDLKELFQNIAKNWENKRKIQNFVNILNNQTIAISDESAKLLNLFGIYKNGQFAYEENDLYQTDMNFNLEQKGYEFAYNIIGNPSGLYPKYYVLVHYMALVPFEEENPNSIKTIIETDIAPTYKALNFPGDSKVVDALQKFGILNNDNEFVLPDPDDNEDGVLFNARYEQCILYLLAVIDDNEKYANQILSDWKETKFEVWKLQQGQNVLKLVNSKKQDYPAFYDFMTRILSVKSIDITTFLNEIQGKPIKEIINQSLLEQVEYGHKDMISVLNANPGDFKAIEIVFNQYPKDCPVYYEAKAIFENLQPFSTFKTVLSVLKEETVDVQRLQDAVNQLKPADYKKAERVLMAINAVQE